MSNWSLKNAFKEYKATLPGTLELTHCGDMQMHSRHTSRGVDMNGKWEGTCEGTPHLAPPAAYVPTDYADWVKTLDSDTRWALCGDKKTHGPHTRTVSFTGETPFPVRCGGVPEFRGTHEERFRALLAEWGITPHTDAIHCIPQEPNTVNLMARYGNMDGYAEHYLCVEFNEDGSFKEMGVWA